MSTPTKSNIRGVPWIIPEIRSEKCKASVYVEVQNIKNVLYLSSIRDGTEYVVSVLCPIISVSFTYGTAKLTVRLVVPPGMSSSDPSYFTHRLGRSDEAFMD